MAKTTKAEKAAEAARRCCCGRREGCEAAQQNAAEEGRQEASGTRRRREGRVEGVEEGGRAASSQGREEGGGRHRTRREGCRQGGGQARRRQGRCRRRSARRPTDAPRRSHPSAALPTPTLGPSRPSLRRRSSRPPLVTDGRSAARSRQGCRTHRLLPIQQGAARRAALVLTRSMQQFLDSRAAAPTPRTLLDILRATAARYPDASALDDGDGALSYSELLAQVGRTAARLQAHGVRRGDRVGVRMPSGDRELYVAILGVMAAGAAYVPVDADDPPERAELVFGEAGGEGRDHRGGPLQNLRPDRRGPASQTASSWATRRTRVPARSTR